jgi:hypothetical protein
MSIMKGKQFALVYTDIFATPLGKLIICVWDSTYSTKKTKNTLVVVALMTFRLGHDKILSYKDLCNIHSD